MRYLILILLVSCSTIKKYEIIKYHGKEVEKETLPFIISFEEKCKVYTNTSVYFSKMSAKNIAGTCNFLTNVVEIDRSYWVNLTYFEKENLIFHEYGHCALFKSHNNSMSTGKPISIMNSSLIDLMTYLERRSEYLKELCHN
jgi:hypothetical protein